ncbi:YopX family protein [Bacillus sp. JCM 19041]|uniref:YopX family protein n=1 Tax=Bacillus sp. JCM 19041 TaxID=1460637 RepID=UPI0006CFB4E7
MREIKFRAWDNKNRVIIPWEKLKFDKDINDDEICFYEDEDGEGWHFVGGADLQIMQYTGLKDKNGTEIYEGDILSWDEKEWGGKFNELVEWDYEQFDTRWGAWKEFCIVIGNKFERPELLNN